MSARAIIEADKALIRCNEKLDQAEEFADKIYEFLHDTNDYVLKAIVNGKGKKEEKKEGFNLVVRQLRDLFVVQIKAFEKVIEDIPEGEDKANVIDAI